MIARACSQPEPATWKELKDWIVGQQLRLLREVQLMPKRKTREIEARLLAWAHGMREMQNEINRLSKKIQRGSDNDRAQASDHT